MESRNSFTFHGQILSSLDNRNLHSHIQPITTACQTMKPFREESSTIETWKAIEPASTALWSSFNSGLTHHANN